MSASGWPEAETALPRMTPERGWPDDCPEPLALGWAGEVLGWPDGVAVAPGPLLLRVLPGGWLETPLLGALPDPPPKVGAEVLMSAESIRWCPSRVAIATPTPPPNTTTSAALASTALRCRRLRARRKVSSNLPGRGYSGVGSRRGRSFTAAPRCRSRAGPDPRTAPA